MDKKNEDEAIHTLALGLLPGVGAVLSRQLISYCGAASRVFGAGYKKLIRIPGIGDKTARQILRKETLAPAEKEFRRCAKEGIRLLFYTDPDYPYRLRPLYDAPLILYAEGKMDLGNRKAIGIVGTRKMTDYGRKVADMMVEELAPFNPLIISGLAYGVDITVHRACLRHGLATVGVMASGIDVIYPKVHEKTARQMKLNGGLLTENPLGTKPDFQRFPARNRIIAGLCDVLILVESAGSGGGLITAEFALNYHREVFAVPGGIYQPMSEGCNRLIRENKAGLFSSVENMALDLGWVMKCEGSGQEKAAPPANEGIFDGFTGDEGQLLSLLRKHRALQIDELSWHSGIHPGKLSTLLLSLEFQGVIRPLPGKKFTLV